MDSTKPLPTLYDTLSKSNPLIYIVFIGVGLSLILGLSLKALRGV